MRDSSIVLSVAVVLYIFLGSVQVDEELTDITVLVGCINHCEYVLVPVYSDLKCINKGFLELIFNYSTCPIRPQSVN